MKVLVRTVSIFLGVFIACLLFLYIAPGYNLFMVRSGSMWPAIGAGDLIVTGPVNGIVSGGIKPGRIITYKRGETYITHRVIELNEDIIVTKGDAVLTSDAWFVRTPDVVGVYLFKIPGVGYYTAFINDPKRWFLVIILPAAVLLWLLFKDIFKARKRIQK